MTKGVGALFGRAVRETREERSKVCSRCKAKLEHILQPDGAEALHKILAHNLQKQRASLTSVLATLHRDGNLRSANTCTGAPAPVIVLRGSSLFFILRFRY